MTGEKIVVAEATRYKTLPVAAKAAFLALCTAGIGLSIVFNFSISFQGMVMADTAYFYLFLACFLPCVFFILRGRRTDVRLPWYDCVAAAIACAIPFFFCLNAWSIKNTGWVPPTPLQFALALALVILVLEGGRRMGGKSYFIVCLVIGLFPLVASYMPGFLTGSSWTISETVALYVFGGSGLLGIPSVTMGEIIIGFLILAGMLIASGAGHFFLSLAMGILGRFRGGPAKISVLGSAFFGMMSGSAVSNVVGTGTFTIPAMKRLGYEPHYAGAVEACASTGGILMPPVMGAVAFVMAVVLQVSYVEVMLAAVIPSVLYYVGLLLQVDAHAAKIGIKGMRREEIPSLRRTLKEGWTFLFVIIFLIWGLVYMDWLYTTAYYASAVLFVLSFTSRRTMMTPKRLIGTAAEVGKIIVQTTALIFPMGFIIGGLTISGVAAAFTANLVSFGGGNWIIVLVLGLVACYILGMVGMMIPNYLFLAVTMAPAIITLGKLNTMAVHLCIMYYSMLACITPPVASAAFVGAAIAGAPPMKTSFTSMRLGIVLYVVPFYFVANPSLILQGPLTEGLLYIALCIIGLTLIGGALEGYVWWLGRVRMWARVLLFISGFLIGLPELITSALGAVLAVAVLVPIALGKRAATPRAAAP